METNTQESRPEACKTDSGFIHTNEKTKQLAMGLAGLLIGFILGFMMRTG